jgi:large subunit ribosomal protein L9
MPKANDSQGDKPKTKAQAKARPQLKQGELPRTRSTVPGPPRQPGVERRRNHPLRAKNGHIGVILTQSVTHLGHAGDLVKVRPGFARNYLLPQGLATFATQHNLRIVEKHRQRLKELEEARKADLQNMAAQIAQRSLTIEANANEEGHLYGSVNAEQIAVALKAEGFPIETEHVRIEGPLKDLGLYTIKINLGQEVDTEVKLWVVPTHGEEATAP